MRSRFQGLCTGPKQPVVPTPSNAISSRFSFPGITVPAALRRATTSASALGDPVEKDPACSGRPDLGGVDIIPQRNGNTE